MIPDYQTLMRPVLEQADNGEVTLKDTVAELASVFQLSEEDLLEMLPSKRAPLFYNRVAWAKTYLQQAGLIKSIRRGVFTITEEGKRALQTREKIDNHFLKRFESFQNFQSRNGNKENSEPESIMDESEFTPNELLRETYSKLNNALAAELIDKIRIASPAFFEYLIVELLVAMGYGGTAENAGQALGKSGDDGIDGVINQDPLGVDQIYVQAKRYAEGNNVSANAIRDFFGALNLKKAQKGLFFTTSDFTPSAVQTAKDLGMRIVLINGQQLAKLMIRYNVGCRDEDIIHIKRLDEDFFEWEGA